ncbi:hypothetical protein VKS41_005922 [Umbelopsis sp. WA50703]
MYQSTNVKDYDVKTVKNQETFATSLELTNFGNVGHSLVAKVDLKAGTQILIEKPILSYALEPKCRSSTSPYYSKKIWNTVCDIVKSKELEQGGHQPIANADDSDYDSDDEDEDGMPASLFCPGVPAAMIAYLSISPPPHLIQRKSPLMCEQSDLGFYYSPDVEEWCDHPTVELIRHTVEIACQTIPEFSHINPLDLISFVLKIYSNAHTVAHENNRTLTTHTKRKQRREYYRKKQEVYGSPLMTTSWPSDPESRVMSKIALLPWGSKFAHSCSPNLFLRYDPAEGTMIFTLIRDLKKGELLTFSYLPEDDSSLGGLLCGTTESRRKKTWNFKFFHCACERCTDWDWSRGVQCQQCSSSLCFKEGGDRPDEERHWHCFDCHAKFATNEVDFVVSGREHNVQQIAVAFGGDIKGTPNQSMLRMMEPYLLSLLDPSTDPYDSDGELKDDLPPPIPKGHWTYAYLHYLLSAYHLRLFGAYFGKGLSKSLGMYEKGFEEASIYVNWLQNNLWSAPEYPNVSTQNGSGNKMAAFFAGWQILESCIDVLFDETTPKSAEDVDESSSDGSISDEDELVNQTSTLNIEKPVNQPIAPPSYLDHCVTMADIVESHWLPIITRVLPQTDNTNDQENVQDNMINKMTRFVMQTRALQQLSNQQ